MRTASALAVLVLVAPLAFAQDAPAPAAPKPVPFPVATAARGFAAGEWHFGLHLNDKNIGYGRVTVTPLPESGLSSDGFHVETELLFDFAGQRMKMGESLDVASTLWVRWFVATQDRAGSVEKVELKPRGDGKADVTRTRTKAGEPAGEPKTSTTDLPTDFVPERLLYVVLGRVPWAEGTRYEIHTDDDGKPITAVARFVSQGPLDLRGKSVIATHIELQRVGSKKPPQSYHLVDGRVVQVAPGGAPVRFVAGTAEECKADLAPTTPADPEAEAVRSCASTFLRAFLTGSAEHAEASIDFVALQQRAATVREEMGMLTPEAFKTLMLDQVKRRAGKIPPETAETQLSGLTALLKIKVEGEGAKVDFPGSSDPMEFAKQPEGWRLVWWAPFSGQR